MKRVLVIDDCHEFRAVMSELLQDAGYDATVTSDIEEALELCEGNRFDVVLCDLVMPFPGDLSSHEEDESAMVGLHMLDQLSIYHPDLPTIIISGKLTGDSLGFVERMGAVATLSKPFSQKDLVQTIEQVMARSKQEAGRG